MNGFNRWGIFWANTGTSIELDILAYRGRLNCYTIMPEALDRVPEIRALYPNAFIQVRHSTPHWQTTDPKTWAAEIKKIYDTPKGVDEDRARRLGIPAGQPRPIGEMVNGWAILNEPDIEPSFPGYGEPIKNQIWRAARWAIDCAKALKELIPSIRLHAPAMAFEDRGYGWDWFMGQWKPVYELCDVVNSHNYWEENGKHSPNALYNPEVSCHHAFRYRQLREWLLKYGITKPIFIEECGNFGPDYPLLWQEMAYFFRELEKDAAFVIGGCEFILKSDKANWCNDLTRQPDIRGFFEQLGNETKLELPYPEAEDIRPKIRVALRLSWQISNSPIIDYEDIPLEEYLLDVLPREMPKYIKALDLNVPLEAFKAQAIAARSFAMYAMKHPRHGDKAHVCNSTHCQVWAPGNRHELSDRAVKETEGIAAYYQGEVINAFYSANCGGHTINSEDIWPQAVPYCREVLCPVAGTINGHRVGLCQYGVAKMAADGKTAKEILTHYYTGITVNLPDPIIPPPPTPPPSEKRLVVIETRSGPPIIVGDLGASAIQVEVHFWDNIATTYSGNKPEYGQGGFELRGWPTVDALFTIEILGRDYQIPVSKAKPWTKVAWSEVAPPQPMPPEPPTPPVPPRPYPDEGLYQVKPGFGIHAGLDFREEFLHQDYARCADLGLKWVLLVPQDEIQLEKAIKIFWPEVLPVIRPYCLIDGQHDFVRDVKIMLKLNAPPYIQIYNEPNDDREWKNGRPNYPLFVRKWVDCAEAVIGAGGWPGLQVLDTDLILEIVKETKHRGIMRLWERMWFCPHNYGLNHPPNYPYDSINQEGTPVEDITLRYVAPIDQINRWREKDKKLGQTIHDDSNGMLGFLAFAKVFQEELGFVPPMICGEGGWQYGSSQDRRYPVVEGGLHAEYHAGMFQWFKTGVLPTEELLPDYLWAVCPWILSGNEADAWYGGPLGSKELTIAKVKEVTLG